MGIVLNPRNDSFQEALNSQIYVDKTMLIDNTNKIICTKQKHICVSRPRRFGKSMAAEMLAAYYSRGCDSQKMFSGLKIAQTDDFQKHLNKYNVIHINIITFLGETKSIEEMIEYIEESILYDLFNEYPDVKYFNKKKFIRSLQDVYTATSIPFVFIIDEWDCIFRIHKNDKESQTKYLDFLRNFLKDQPYVALAYMTGILPIKKYGEHSALNIFTEISMTDPRKYAEFTGFTEAEIQELCGRFNMSLEETRRWYNGYNLMGTAIYNPRSVVMSMTGHVYNNYWTQTETYEALKEHIIRNEQGLKDKVTALIAGESIEINTKKFQNDMTTFTSADDVLTLLIHLGYLTYDFYTKKVRIPNMEVADEFINSIEDGGWENVMEAIKESDELVKATINGEEEKVAGMIDHAHSENTSILKYNDENSLSCVISIAYYSARKNYVIHREMPSGKGFADLVFIPRVNSDMPAMVVELKHNSTAETAIEQIRNKNYTDSLKDYSGKILLVGISYDGKEKKHTCRIEEIEK